MQLTDRICRFAECPQLDGGFSSTVSTRTCGGFCSTHRATQIPEVHMKRFVLRWAILFIAANIFGFVVHGLLLQGDYAATPQLLRTQDDANRHFVYMLVGFASSAAALVWIYGNGQSRPWLGQGIRFGIAVWMLTSLPWFLTYYAVQPWPGAVVAKQISFELVTVLLMGIINAGLHRRESAEAQTPAQAAAEGVSPLGTKESVARNVAQT